MSLLNEEEAYPHHLPYPIPNRPAVQRGSPWIGMPGLNPATRRFVLTRKRVRVAGIDRRQEFVGDERLNQHVAKDFDSDALVSGISWLLRL